MNSRVGSVRISRWDGSNVQTTDDLLVTEEPLEIRLGHGPIDDRKEIQLSVTMRTPGNDEELAIGFLFTEGIISDPSALISIKHCQSVKKEEEGNVIRAELDPSIEIDLRKWQRNFYTTSSCGVCGKSSIDAVQLQCSAVPAFTDLDPKIIVDLPEKMRAAQTIFRNTGGIHAAALFDRNGDLLIIREDIGRHNAVDKVIGSMLIHAIDPTERIMLVSGRAGFELVQKCAIAGISLMVAVGAPSSLSVDLARSVGITLIGFLRGGTFNIYS